LIGRYVKEPFPVDMLPHLQPKQEVKLNIGLVMHLNLERKSLELQLWEESSYRPAHAAWNCSL
jgi:hypothetical protein